MLRKLAWVALTVVNLINGAIVAADLDTSSGLRFLCPFAAGMVSMCAARALLIPDDRP